MRAFVFRVPEYFREKGKVLWHSIRNEWKCSPSIWAWRFPFLLTNKMALNLKMCNCTECSGSVPFNFASSAITLKPAGGGGPARGEERRKAGGWRDQGPISFLAWGPIPAIPHRSAAGSTGQITLGSEQESKYKNDHENCPTGQNWFQPGTEVLPWNT